MADTKTSALPDAGAIAGTEIVPVVQSGSNRKLSLSALLTWITAALAAAARLVPTGGTNGQVLRANVDGDPVFETVGLVPAGSVMGYVLRQTGSGPYDHGWGAVRELPEVDPGGLDTDKFVKWDGGSWVYAFAPDQSAGSDGQLQYKATGGGFAGASKAGIGASGSLELAADSAPTTPAAGKNTTHLTARGGRTQLATLAHAGAALPLQPSLAHSRLGYWSTIGGANTAPTGVGIVAPSLGSGTAAARTPAATNLLTSTRRIGNRSAATAGSSAGFRASTRLFFRNTSDPWGGFYCVFRFGEGDIVSDSRAFCGMIADNGLIANVNPSTLLSIAGMAYDSGDTNWYIVHNDTSGTATKVDLGADYPCNTDDTAYEITIWAPAGESSVWVEVWRMGTAHRTTVEITSDLPASGTLLAPQLWVNNGPTAAAKTVDLIHMVIESDY